MNTKLTEQQKNLVEENHNLIYEFAHRHNLPIENYYGILAIGMCKAAKKFNGDSGAFSTLAFVCMKNTVLNYWNHEVIIQKAISKDKIVSYDACDASSEEPYLNCIADNVSTSDIVISKMMYESFLDKLTEIEKIITQLLMEDVPQNQIAERLGYSKQNISSHINRIRKKMAKFFNNY